MNPFDKLTKLSAAAFPQISKQKRRIRFYRKLALDSSFLLFYQE